MNTAERCDLATEKHKTANHASLLRCTSSGCPEQESMKFVYHFRTTYQYHSKRINKTPNTGIIPVNVEHWGQKRENLRLLRLPR